MNSLSQYDMGARAFNAGHPLDTTKSQAWQIGWEDAREFFETFHQKY